MSSTITFKPFIALAILALAGCSGKKEAPKAMPPLPVMVQEAKSSDAATYMEIVGQTEGVKNAEVRPRVGGILLKKLYVEGESVKAGQALFQLDQAPYQATLDQARAALAGQKVRSEQATRDLERLKKLVGTQAVSQKEYDDGVANAAANDAALKAAEAALKTAELNLSYATVTSPVSGISGRAQRSDGSLVSASDMLTTVVEADPLWVRFSLSETDLAKLPGKRVTPGVFKAIEIIFDDGSVYEAKGKLNFTATVLDARLGTQELRAEFANKDVKIMPGQFVKVRLTTGTRKGVFLVPQVAVMQSEQGNFVFVVDDKSTAQVRPVKAGDWQGSNWVILDGLKNGDKVIVNNLIKVRPGAPVSLLPPGAKH